MNTVHNPKASFIQVVAGTANQALILQMSVPIKYFKYLLNADNTT